MSRPKKTAGSEFECVVRFGVRWWYLCSWAFLVACATESQEPPAQVRDDDGTKSSQDDDIAAGTEVSSSMPEPPAVPATTSATATPSVIESPDAPDATPSVVESSDASDAGTGGEIGTDAGGAECMVDDDCAVIPDDCCHCGGPPLERAVILPRREVLSRLEATCLGDCEGCTLTQSHPYTLFPICVDGQCDALDIREQDYTLCDTDEDCVLIPRQCCGGSDPAWCFNVLAGNSYAVNASAESLPDLCYGDCSGSEPSNIQCQLEPDVYTTAYCADDGHCALTVPVE